MRTALFILLSFTAAAPRVSAQGDIFVLQTDAREITAWPAQLSIVRNNLVISADSGDVVLPIEELKAVHVRSTSGFWDGAADGALWGAGLGSVSGLAAGIGWAATGSNSAGETASFIALPTLVFGGICGALGGIIGGLLSSLDGGDSYDLSGASVEDKRILLRELLME